MKRLIVILSVQFIVCTNVFSQEKFDLHIVLDRQLKTTEKWMKKDRHSFSSSGERLEFLNAKIQKLRNRNYLEANIDSIQQIGFVLMAFVHVGERYLLKAHFADADGSNNVSGTPSDFKLLAKYQRKLLRDLNSKGYPFAKIVEDSIQFAKHQISGNWRIEKGTYVTWDKIISKGNLGSSKTFLQKYLDIREGKAYNENRLLEISNRINALDFAREIKPAEIEFSDQKARLYTYIDREAANQVDGIIGFQSNSKEKKQLSLTGEINLNLSNAFRNGEQIYLQWKKYESQSQNLKLGLSYPYLVSKMGFDFDYALLKQDSSYLTHHIQLGLRIFQKGSTYLQFFYNYQSSSLLSTQNYANASVLPDFADTKTNLWGLGFHFQNLDHPFNPHRGVKVNSQLGLGKYRIRKLSELPEALYNGVKLNSSLLNVNWQAEVNFPLSEKFSYRIVNRAAAIESANTFSNDLLRLGGLKSLRGFNEDAFLASRYMVFSNELRLIPEKNTSFYLFCDAAYYKSELQAESFEDHPIGLGFGLNFVSGSGIFSLSYAVGKQKNQSFSLRDAKIHFGFVSRF